MYALDSFADTPEDKYFHMTARPVIQKHCSACHNEVDKKAGLNLADVYFAIGVTRQGETFQNVVREVETGNMPPAGKPRLSAEEMDQLLTGIRTLLGNALAQPDPGQSIMRRLSHREYRYTMLDLMGVDFDAQYYFPSEGSGGEGFDNQGRVLFITPLTMERYYEAADSILRQVRKDPVLWTKLVPETYHPGLGQRLSFWWNKVVRKQEIMPEAGIAVANRQLYAFATRAYRRFLSEGEKAQLTGFFTRVYRDQWKEEEGFERALIETMKSILVSPNFLYRYEANLPLEKPYQLSNFELATRLSYLLWSSMPDETLINVAYREDLHDPKILTRETRRMMADPKFMRFAESFAGQWLEVEQVLKAPKTDLEKFPELTVSLREAMYQEAVQYFYYVFTQSRNLLELIDSDYTFLNEDLARHYGIEGVKGKQMQPVLLTDRRRGGILGMGAVLTATSLPLRTSPVLRGKWVLEQVLGTPPPPPPPDVPELEAAKGKVKNELDLRALLAQHRAPSSCSGCHQKMDPIGLGLENFDAIGRWRDSYGGNTKVDAAGVLVSGQAFEGPGELKQILCEDREKFARNISRKLISFALGRGVDFKDSPTLDQLTQNLLDNEFDSQHFMLTLVNSFPFRYKRSDTKDRYKEI
jgi:hypothetical protein